MENQTTETVSGTQKPDLPTTAERHITRHGKTASDYTMKVRYIKPQLHCGQMKQEWTYRGDNWLDAYRERFHYVEELEALFQRLTEINDNVQWVRVFDNTTNKKSSENILYERSGDTIAHSPRLSGYYITRLKKKGLL